MEHASDSKIVMPSDKDWGAISELISKSIPNAIISHLGINFGKLFYRSLSEHKCSCAYVYKNSYGSIKGVIIGTSDHSASYSAIKKYKYKLLLAVNVRVFKWTVIKWIVLNMLSQILGSKKKENFSAKAELIAIALSPDLRGKGVSEELIRCMENDFIHESTVAMYYILTEKENERANKFYNKIGAELFSTFVSRGRLINCWHKRLNR